MKKADVVITTPQKSVIYAYGTTKPEKPDIFMGYRNQMYRECYVLSIGGTGNPYAYILLRDELKPGGNSYDRVDEKDVASELDALDYTIADYLARRKVFETYSHWPLSPEQTEARDAAIAELKPLPAGWNIHSVNVQHIRYLWAEYVTKRDAYVQAQADEKRRAKEDETRRELLHTVITTRLKTIGIDVRKFASWQSGIELSYEDLTTLMTKAGLEP